MVKYLWYIGLFFISLSFFSNQLSSCDVFYPCDRCTKIKIVVENEIMALIEEVYNDDVLKGQYYCKAIQSKFELLIKIQAIYSDANINDYTVE